MNLDNHGRGTSPLRKGRNVAAEGGVVYLIDQDPEEGGGLIVRIGLELGVDVDDEGRSHCGEQTGLRRESIGVFLNDGCNVRILGSCWDPLEKFLVIFLGLFAVTFVELATKIFCGWRHIYFLAEQGFRSGRQSEAYPIAGCSICFPFPSAFKFL